MSSESHKLLSGSRGCSLTYVWSMLVNTCCGVVVSELTINGKQKDAVRVHDKVHRLGSFSNARDFALEPMSFYRFGK